MYDMFTLNEEFLFMDELFTESESLDSFNEAGNSNRKQLALQAQNKLKSALNKTSFAKHVKYTKASDFDKDYMDGNYSEQMLCIIDLWKVTGNARAAMEDGRAESFSKELSTAVKKVDVNGGRLEIGGDWDSYMISFVID